MDDGSDGSQDVPVTDMAAVAFGVVVSVALAWLAFIVLLVIWRPRGLDLREAKRLVPDVVRLVRAIASDEDVPRKVRWRVMYLLAYLACPIDLVPDFVPAVGYADDVVIIAVVLRGVVRAAGPDVVHRHWTGTPTGLGIVTKLSGVHAFPSSP